MNKFFTIIILIFAFFGESYACLNEGKISKEGTYLYYDYDDNVPYGHILKNNEDYEVEVRQLDKLYKATKDLDYLSDKGLILILLKQYDKAIKLYLDIEKMQPNRYSTASNIGTSYELLGQYQKALMWIKKSVEIDPTSHENSEWIHVKILEAKIKGEKFYTSTFLLNTDFGLDTKVVSNLRSNELQKLSDDLYYQLNERVSFVRPNDKIIALLLFDLGNIATLLNNYNDALADYEKAKEYGFTGQLIEKRIKEANELSRKAQKTSKQELFSSTQLLYFACIAGIFLLVIIAMIFYKRKKKNNS